MIKQSSIWPGMNGRFFPANWRPAVQEIAFAETIGFRALQFAMRDGALTPERLDASYETVAEQLQAAGITPVMEIVMGVNSEGKDPRGFSALEVLQEQLPAIRALSIYAAHWHFVPAEPMTAIESRATEKKLYPDLRAGVALAGELGCKVGIEHNEPALHLFGPAAACAEALDAVPGLHFVWDLNHTIPDALADFLALTPRMSMLHVSDTPLPTVNYHLPLGLGTVDFLRYFNELIARGFHGPAILEIGGLPQSGGYGRDTDEALADSFERLVAATPTVKGKPQ